MVAQFPTLVCWFSTVEPLLSAYTPSSQMCPLGWSSKAEELHRLTINSVKDDDYSFWRFRRLMLRLSLRHLEISVRPNFTQVFRKLCSWNVPPSDVWNLKTEERQNGRKRGFLQTHFLHCLSTSISCIIIVVVLRSLPLGMLGYWMLSLKGTAIYFYNFSFTNKNDSEIYRSLRYTVSEIKSTKM